MCIRVSWTGTQRSNEALNPVKTFHLINFACFWCLPLHFSQTVNAARRHHGDTETLRQCRCWQQGSLLRESIGKYREKRCFNQVFWRSNRKWHRLLLWSEIPTLISELRAWKEDWWSSDGKMEEWKDGQPGTSAVESDEPRG